MSTTPPLKLWFSPGTRSVRPRWLLEELGVPYELVAVDMRAGAHKAPTYLAEVHPHGAVPAATIDGVHIIESGAIIATLADRFADKGLAPALDAPERAAYLQWLFYGYATMEPCVHTITERNKALAGTELSDEKRRSLEDSRARELQRWEVICAFVERELGRGPWLLGEHFSAADVVIGSILTWALALKVTTERAPLVAYAERIKSRPAFHRARKLPTDGAR